MRFISCALIFISFALQAGTASAEESEIPDSLFQDVELLEATITAPLTTLVKEKNTDLPLGLAFLA